ncbi:MAG TPA: TraM recognition domain-containing protein [Streptosporangiaceae bacterium]|nr:TraM recognition domain-containing protein [Streptosporangiaceae bacterium]
MTYFIWLMSALAIAAVLRWCVGPHSRLPRFRVRYLRLRLHLRLHPGRGHATAFELWLRWGRLAAFRRSRRARQSLSAWHRLTRPGQHSLVIGRAHYGHRLRVPVEEHVLVMAPPRTRKTGLLAKIILRYPGPVVSTTTKHDVFELTSGIRSRRGPVHVFNPQSIGCVPSTFRWNPVAGCEDPATAIRRADGFANAVSMTGTESATFWSSKASSYLRCLFHAAAIAGGDMNLVTRWALGDAETAEVILAEAGASQWALELAELRSEAQKTAQTIRMVITRALAFMADPALAQSALPGDYGGFDIEDFLRQSGTLYLIAAAEHDDSPVAPLFAAMAGEIHHVATQIGQAQPGGRLDPPLLMALDEIVQTCPVPLPSWLADSGGKGIQIIPVAHGEAQLRTRWDKDGAQVVLDTCGVKILLPGITDTATLKMASELCGQAAFTERVRHYRYSQAHSEDRRVWHDVMTADMIRQLPVGHGLVIRGSMSPVIARLGVAWKDRAYKSARRTGTSIALLGPAAQPADRRPGRAPHLTIVPDLDDPEARPPDDEDGTSFASTPWR